MIFFRFRRNLKPNFLGSVRLGIFKPGKVYSMRNYIHPIPFSHKLLLIFINFLMFPMYVSYFSTCHFCAIMNGVSGIVVFSAPSAVSSAWFPPNERTTATGIALVFNNLGKYIVFKPLLIFIDSWLYTSSQYTLLFRKCCKFPRCSRNRSRSELQQNKFWDWSCRFWKFWSETDFV